MNREQRRRQQHTPHGAPQPLRIDYGFTPTGQIVINLSLMTRSIALEPASVDHMIEQLQNAKKMSAEHQAKAKEAANG